MVKASIFYRIASVLLVLFAVGHTLGFRKTNSSWGADALVASMKAIHFDAQGFSRSYWDFYVGFGLFVTVFLLFAAVLTWQMAGLAGAGLAAMRGPAWALVVCLAVITVMTWRYFFVMPLVFCIVVTVCLFVGAWLTPKAS